jgi:Cu2+-exporting ATPase
LEGLVKATDLVLDKTGTLTMGRPELKEVLIARPEFSRSDVLSLVLAMESGQKHPLALSLLRVAEAENISQGTLSEPVCNQLGKGLSSGIYRLGSAAWVGTQQVEQEGQYGQVHLADDKGLIASFIFLDTLRVGLEELLAAAKLRKITVHLVSGDDPATVAWWAHQVGIENYKGACTPEDKYHFIEALQDEGRFVWAIGDGINDSPLLARANVSIAVGAGAPLVAAGADAILTAISLEPLAKTILLADKTAVVIKENLLWALIYNLLAIPVAMMGWVNPWVAGIGMSLSSLAVTLNAWRLRKA